MTGKELRTKRKLLGLTQPELAQRIGVSKGTIINYEKGNTSIPDSKTQLLQMVFGEEEERKYKLDTVLNLLNENIKKGAEKIPNPRQYVVTLLLDHFHPTEIIDYIQNNKTEFFGLEEFNLMAKNASGYNDVEILKFEVQRIKQRLDDMSDG